MRLVRVRRWRETNLMGKRRLASRKPEHDIHAERGVARLDMPDGSRIVGTDDNDWTEVRKFRSEFGGKRAPLACYVGECKTRLHSVERKTGTRFFRRGGAHDCSHAVGTGGGGTEKLIHSWAKTVTAAILRELGMDAVVEHGPTRSDVWVPALHTSLELQRVRTKLNARTWQRFRSGAHRVLWFLIDSPEDNIPTEWFHSDTVRLKPQSGTWHELVRDAPCTTDGAARVVAYGPLYRLDRTSLNLVPTRMAYPEFLKLALGGTLVWDKGQAGVLNTGWYRKSDLKSWRGHESAQQSERVTPDVRPIDPPMRDVPSPAIEKLSETQFAPASSRLVGTHRILAEWQAGERDLSKSSTSHARWWRRIVRWAGRSR